jgi:hypothetical protein
LLWTCTAFGPENGNTQYARKQAGQVRNMSTGQDRHVCQETSRWVGVSKTVHDACSPSPRARARPRAFRFVSLRACVCFVSFRSPSLTPIPAHPDMASIVLPALGAVSSSPTRLASRPIQTALCNMANGLQNRICERRAQSDAKGSCLRRCVCVCVWPLSIRCCKCVSTTLRAGCLPATGKRVLLRESVLLFSVYEQCNTIW